MSYVFTKIGKVSGQEQLLSDLREGECFVVVTDVVSDNVVYRKVVLGSDEFAVRIDGKRIRRIAYRITGKTDYDHIFSAKTVVRTVTVEQVAE